MKYKGSTSIMTFAVQKTGKLTYLGTIAWITASSPKGNGVYFANEVFLRKHLDCSSADWC